MDFGEYPLHLFLSDVDGLYHVAAEHVEAAAEAAVTETFEVERYAIMKARAAAHGYQFVAVDPPTDEPKTAEKAG